MISPLRRLAAAALLTLCATPAALPQATNLPARANSSFGVNTNGVVKVPFTNVYWPTQTLRINAATITNLTVGTVSGIDATEVALLDVADNFATNTVESALIQLSDGLGAVDVSNFVAKTGDTMSGALNMGINNITNVNYLSFDAVSSAADNSLYVNGTESLIYRQGAGSASPGTEQHIIMSSTGLLDPRYFLSQAGATSGQALVWDPVDEWWEPADIDADSLGGVAAAGYLTTATAATTYLKLDASNDPIVGHLAIHSDYALTANSILPSLPWTGMGSASHLGDGGEIWDRLYVDSIWGPAGSNLSMSSRILDGTWTATTNLVAAAFIGNGSGLTGLDAGDISAGTLATARLGSGTANSTTYLRGDQTWATVSAGIAGSTGSTDNLALRADGAGGSTLQSSDLSIEDVSTSTTNNLQLKNNHAGQTNSALVLTPKGTGAIIAGPRPDGTATGGNARGASAIDLQTIRAAPTDVASGLGSFIGGGSGNSATTWYSTVSGGFNNDVSGNDYGTIGGGLNNAASNSSATIAGGRSNTASGSLSAVGGGWGNLASGANSFVGGGGTGAGGYGNTASGTGSVVGGGSENSSTTTYAATLGGQNNNSTATHASALGGYDCDAAGAYSSTLGGYDSDTSAPYSAAQGLYARATLHGQLATASGRFTTSGDAQASCIKLFRSFSGTAATELFLDGTSLQADMGAANRVWAVSAQIIGTVVSVGNGAGIAVGDTGIFLRSLGIKRITNDAGTALVGTVQTLGTDQVDAGFAGGAVTFSADTGTGSLKLTGTPPTGAGSTTVTKWMAVLDLTELAP